VRPSGFVCSAQRSLAGLVGGFESGKHQKIESWVRPFRGSWCRGSRGHGALDRDTAQRVCTSEVTSLTDCLASPNVRSRRGACADVLGDGSGLKGRVWPAWTIKTDGGRVATRRGSRCPAMLSGSRPGHIKSCKRRLARRAPRFEEALNPPAGLATGSQRASIFPNRRPHVRWPRWPGGQVARNNRRDRRPGDLSRRPRRFCR
jgi:hypothetical protein